MMQRNGQKRGLSKIWKARLQGDYREALDEVNRLLDQNPDQAPLLVMRAELIQLQDSGEGVPSLDSAKQDLQRAISIDENSPVALIELGYFLFSMEDDAEQASARFREAISLCRDLLEEALIGQAKVLHEQEHDADALACLVEAHALRKRSKQNDELLLERSRAILEST